jgi:hypothetical protein
VTEPLQRTGLANLCNSAALLWDTTLYAVHMLSRNLDFSSRRFGCLAALFQKIE